MIHLSRFLVGVRHKRVFKIRNVSGHLVDRLIEILPETFNKVDIRQHNEEFKFVDGMGSAVKIDKDDVIVEQLKIFDNKERSYVEIKKSEVIALAKELSNASKRSLITWK